MKKEYLYAPIGRRLKELRGRFTQGEFSSLIGIPQSQYSRYETGKVMPPKAVLERISAELLIPIEWILTGEQKRDEIGRLREAIGKVRGYFEKEMALNIPAHHITEDEWATILCLRMLRPDERLALLKELLVFLRQKPVVTDDEYLANAMGPIRDAVFGKKELEVGVDYDKLIRQQEALDKLTNSSALVSEKGIVSKKGRIGKPKG
jgi:transcriptional regulator with XRE-family HTH domain